MDLFRKILPARCISVLGFGLCLYCVTPQVASAHAPDLHSAMLQSTWKADSGNDAIEESFRGFQTAFSELSAKYHATVIAEGVPFRQALTDDELKALSENLRKSQNVPPQVLIQNVALAFDYDSEQVGANLFILRKRYSNQNDLPGVTYSEVVYSLKSILAITDQFGAGAPVATQSWMIFPLYASLTTGQKARLKDGLALADLDPNQRELFLSATRQAVLDNSTNTLRMVLARLEGLQDHRTVFRQLVLPEGNSFGFEGLFGAKGQMLAYPVSNGFTCQFGGAYTYNPPRPKSEAITPVNKHFLYLGNFGFGFIEQPGVEDPFEPTELDRALAPGMLSRRLPSTVRLSEALESLSSSSGGKIVASADDAIGDKPVSLFGSEYTEPGRVIRALGSVYGLLVRVPDEKRYFITLQEPRQLTRTEDAAVEIVRLSPSPLLRYFEAQRMQIVKMLPEKPMLQGLPEERHKVMVASRARSAVSKAELFASEAGYFPAARRLRVLVEPSVPTSDATPVPVASSGQEPSRLVTLLLLSGPPINQLINLKDFKPPKCLMNPDSIRIKLDVFRDNGNLSIGGHYGYVDEQGTFIAEGFNVAQRSDPSTPK